MRGAARLRALRVPAPPGRRELLATGHTVHACVDLDGRVQRMPRELLERLSAGEAARRHAFARKRGDHGSRSRVASSARRCAPLERFFELVDRLRAVPGVRPRHEGVPRPRTGRGRRDSDVEYEVDLGVKTIRYVLRHVRSAPRRWPGRSSPATWMKVSSGSWELADEGGQTRARYTRRDPDSRSRRSCPRPSSTGQRRADEGAAPADARGVQGPRRAPARVGRDGTPRVRGAPRRRALAALAVPRVAAPTRARRRASRALDPVAAGATIEVDPAWARGHLAKCGPGSR